MRARVAIDPEDSSANRTMRRGLAILRAFRPGLSVLTNGDLAERTGLARSTVSRLTGALVDSGLLRQLPGAGGYAPTAACVSLGFAALQSLGEPRQRVVERMQQAAEDENVSVSLAIPDGHEMIYVDTFRKALREKLLHIQPGARLPMEATALGRAALAAMAPPEREARIDQLLARQKSGAARLRGELRDGVAHHLQHGWVRASWVPDIVSVARAVQPAGYPVFAFNCTGPPARMTPGKIERRLVPLLMELTGLLLGPTPASTAASQAR
jgi:DNA-binding IclR family transcriptional regulator